MFSLMAASIVYFIVLYFGVVFFKVYFVGKVVNIFYNKELKSFLLFFSLSYQFRITDSLKLIQFIQALMKEVDLLLHIFVRISP